ncbi:uncharacterized protein LODBEIA_P43040 [Lodderomyces beijingensis]|uniref:VASt domain-containing protein n=1 Tax=Lodderomyces beijingensis TaxID=1775926 RepID=A0ABP0ZV34_9ASCO
MAQTASIEEDDPWSYNFPSSNESLPLETDRPQPSQKINPQLASLRRGRMSDQSEIHSRLASSFVSNGLQPSEVVDSNANVRSSISFSSTLQKSPLHPLTTKEDASSVISRDSNGASINNENTPRENENPRLLKNLKEYESSIKLQPAPSSEKEEVPKVVSPKIIAYRKSKRTSSDGAVESMAIEPTALPTTPPPTRKYDSKLYTDEFYKDSQYRYAIMKRNIDFHQLFRSLDLTDRLLDDFSCALSREILLQGRCYISESYLCFNSSLLGWVTNLVVKFENIVKIEKKSTAGLFPNGIGIETEEGQTHTFATFLSRDQTYDLMTTVWKGKTGRVNAISPSAKEEEEETKEVASGSPTPDTSPKIQSYIMSLDGDDKIAESDDLDESDDSDVSDFDVDSGFDGVDVVGAGVDGADGLPNGDINRKSSTKGGQRLVTLKSSSPYVNRGPDSHPPTIPKYEKFPQEVELVEETFQAPMGVVFSILFGSCTKFQTSFLERHDGSDISDLTEFHPAADDPAILQREFTYRRALGYSIGPKSTRCEIVETIEHLNFADYVVVTTTTHTPDVPSGGVFAVKTRYVFSWGENNTTKLLISHYVEWKGKSWMKAVIEKSSLSGSTTIMNQLIQELKDEIADNVTTAAGAPTRKISKRKKKKEAEAPKVATKDTVGLKKFTIPTDVRSVVYVFFILFTIMFLMQAAVMYQLSAMTRALNRIASMPSEQYKGKS